jgi:hypothetical protein
MIPVIHIFYSVETKTQGFGSLILYPMKNAMTDMTDGGADVTDVRSAQAVAVRGRIDRGIDSRSPMIAHKVTRAHLNNIRRHVKG